MFKPNQIVQFDQSDETDDQTRNAQLIRNYVVNIEQKQVRQVVCNIFFRDHKRPAVQFTKYVSKHEPIVYL